jgi:hypothetical protein
MKKGSDWAWTEKKISRGSKAAQSPARRPARGETAREVQSPRRQHAAEPKRVLKSCTARRESRPRERKRRAIHIGKRGGWVASSQCGPPSQKRAMAA